MSNFDYNVIHIPVINADLVLSEGRVYYEDALRGQFATCELFHVKQTESGAGPAHREVLSLFYNELPNYGKFRKLRLINFMY